ncbi:MAG: hypothetical protein US97_C0036G0009, partial [Microgenomates group bacterium GW2011_GWF1_38_5]
SLNKQFSIVSYSQKLNNIEPGDLLSIVYDEDDGHNVIFIEWKDKVKGLAKVFDWNAKVIYEGAKSSGQECTSENFYSSSKKYCKVYQYTEKYILLDNKNSVYMYWKPYVPSSSSEIGKESPWGYFNPEEPEEETETEVDLSGLSSEQKKVYSSASECSDCRGGNIFSVIFNGNPCDEELCEAIEEKIGDSNCEYSNGYCKKGSSFSGESGSWAEYDLDIMSTRQKNILPNAFNNLKPGGKIISLIKPHYEAKKARLTSDQVNQVIEITKKEIEEVGGRIEITVESPILGEKGKNREFLALIVPK